MTRDLSPRAVVERLERLRASYVPMTAEEARHLLTAPARTETFSEGVARRLAELRALLDLTTHLHRAHRVGASEVASKPKER